MEKVITHRGHKYRINNKGNFWHIVDNKETLIHHHTQNKQPYIGILGETYNVRIILMELFTSYDSDYYYFSPLEAYTTDMEKMKIVKRKKKCSTKKLGSDQSTKKRVELGEFKYWKDYLYWKMTGNTDKLIWGIN